MENLSSITGSSICREDLFKQLEYELDESVLPETLVNKTGLCFYLLGTGRRVVMMHVMAVMIMVLRSSNSAFRMLRMVRS